MMTCDLCGLVVLLIYIGCVCVCACVRERERERKRESERETLCTGFKYQFTNYQRIALFLYLVHVSGEPVTPES